MRTFAILLLVMAAFVCSPAPLGAQDADAPPLLVVEAGEEIRTIPPTVYGANYGLLNAIPVDLTEQAKNSGIRYWRFPGGRVGDLSDLQPSQIDLFMIFVRAFNIEPSISVRLENGTPEAAAELVRYVNIEKKYGVRLWSIGNEPNLFDDYTPEQQVQDWRAIAEAMRAVDPDILLMGPDTSQFTGFDGHEDLAHEFLRVFLQENGHLVDIVSVHRYPFPANGTTPATIEDLRADAPKWTLIVENLREWVQTYTGRDDLPLAIAEANSHWSSQIGGEGTTDSYYNAIWWADVLGRIISGGVDYVGYFNMQSSGRLGGFGLLATYEVRPTYYVYQLYQQFGETLVASQAPDDDVTVYAALRQDGALTVIVINMTAEAQTRALQINDFTPTAAEAQILTASRNVEATDAPALDSAPFTLELAPQSVTLLILQQ
jgi:hypothetical protein